ncbi:MAG TPA: Hsp70 family protein [Gemmatimonadales bacterium]|nr:Hsp70 family protein [Gemmatimonadales bacterium]
MKRALPIAIAVALAGCKSESRPPALGESIAVEQPGGSATQLIEQGTEIPTSATEAFTTSRDDEARIAVHVVRGNGRTAGKLRSEGWWTIDGVTPGRAGEPQILVTFEVDGQGRLGVSARQDERKLKVTRVDSSEAKLKPAALVEPEDADESEEDPE